jgi:hypothetical protein
MIGCLVVVSQSLLLVSPWFDDRVPRGRLHLLHLLLLPPTLQPDVLHCRHSKRSDSSRTQLHPRRVEQTRGEAARPEDYPVEVDRTQDVLNNLVDLLQDEKTIKAEVEVEVDRTQDVLNDLVDLLQDEKIIRVADNISANSKELFADYKTRFSKLEAERVEAFQKSFKDLVVLGSIKIQ